MEQKRIAIIGCGNLGLSILNGLLDDGYQAELITATKRNLESIQHYQKMGVTVTSDNIKAVEKSDIIILALKPYTILPVTESLKEVLDEKKHTLVSLATGITLNQIQEAAQKKVAVFRAMPNTAADVKESITCICTKETNEELTNDIKGIFNQLGESVIIDENLMEAATVLGACGVAYALRFIRAMIQGGIQIGFDAKTAAKIVNQVVKGSAELLIERKQHPEHEIDKVTTPKGCTIVGLNEMEHNGFSSALIKGITASYKDIEK